MENSCFRLNKFKSHVYQVSTYPKGNNVYSNASVLRSQQALTCAGIVQFQSVLPAAVVYAYNHFIIYWINNSTTHDRGKRNILP